MKTKDILIIAVAILIVAFIVYGDKHFGNKGCDSRIQSCIPTR